MDNEKRICRKCCNEYTIDSFPFSNGYRLNTCKMCLAKDQKIRRGKNKEGYRLYQRNFYAKNKDRINSHTKTRREMDRFQFALRNGKHYAKKNGYVPCSATVDELKESFTGKCCLCGVPECECEKHLRMDHDHITGQFRGFLCHNCNVALGLLKDDGDLMRRAADYVEKHLINI